MDHGGGRERSPGKGGGGGDGQCGQAGSGRNIGGKKPLKGTKAP